MPTAGKKIDLSLTVYELCRENPETAEILKDLGFTDIKAGHAANGGSVYDRSQGGGDETYRFGAYQTGV